MVQWSYEVFQLTQGMRVWRHFAPNRKWKYADTLHMFKVKGSKVKVTLQLKVSAVKRYKSGRDIVWSISNLAWAFPENDCHVVGRPQVAIHSQLPHFLFAISVQIIATLTQEMLWGTVESDFVHLQWQLAQSSPEGHLEQQYVHCRTNRMRNFAVRLMNNYYWQLKSIKSMP